MSDLRLVSGTASVIVDASNGGRLASLSVDDVELLVPPGSDGPLQWGCYPMVPWAGRVRDGRFEFEGDHHQLPRNLAPHSAHGVGFTSPWSIVDGRTIGLDLGSPWPFGGRATQRFDLDDGGLTITMTVEASSRMPVMVGWHPWFNRSIDGGGGPVEARLTFGPSRMYELDSAAIPTGALVAPPPGPWDNCFTSLQHQPTIEWPGILTLGLTSSCDHWVVYTEPAHALCVEPQSDAPDAFNRDPAVIRTGEQLQAWFRIAWTPDRTGPSPDHPA